MFPLGGGLLLLLLLLLPGVLQTALDPASPALVEGEAVFIGLSAFQKITLGIPLPANEIDEEGWTALPGIGPKLAARIVAERRRRGGFRNPEELMEVQGIGPKIFAQIEGYITLND